MKTHIFFAFVFLTFAAMISGYAFIKYWLLPFFRLLKNYDKAIGLVKNLNNYPVKGDVKDKIKNFEERGKLIVKSGISKEEFDLITKKSFIICKALIKKITEVLYYGKESTQIFRKKSATERRTGTGTGAKPGTGTGTGTETTGRARRFPRRNN